MNREIKFRGFDTVKKRMFEVYGLGPDFVTENTLNGVDSGTNAFSGEDFKRIKIMQFTNLCDRSGKDIYESDIIGWIGGIAYETMEVYWRNGSWHFKRHECGGIDWLKVDTTEIEVIGNIYSNPELINF